MDSLELLKSHVDAYTRKDGAVVQAHDDKRVAAQKIPPLSAHADALRRSSKPGELDHEVNQTAADHMEANDHQSLKATLRSADTAARDHILDHVHPDHREGLGFEQINMDRSKKQYAEKFPAKTGAKPAAPKFDGASVAKKHDTKMVRKGTEWDHDGYDGKKIPASDVAGAPEFSHKEVYGHDHKTSPAGTDFSPEFAAKGHDHFVLKHPGGQRSFVNTEGGKYARYHAPVEAGASAKPAASSGPAEGEVGHEEHKQYGAYFKKGDKVKDNYGKHHEVLSHRGPEVHTTGGSFHPTKVHRA